MKRPLNFAILKHMTTVDKASATDVVAALKGEYPTHRKLNEKDVLESLMTATENGLLVEETYTLDDKGELVMYYSAPAECAEQINKYIKD